MADCPAVGTTAASKSWDSLLARLEQTSQPSSTNKAGTDENGGVLPPTRLPQQHGDHWPDRPLHRRSSTPSPDPSLLPQQRTGGSGCKMHCTGLDPRLSPGGPAGRQATLVTHLMLEAK